MSGPLRSVAPDRLQSLGFGAAGALLGAFVWRTADGALHQQTGSALGLQAPEAWVVLGSLAGLGLVAGLAFALHALETRRRWTAFAARLEALVDGDLARPIPMLDKAGASGRLARAVLAVRERTRAAEQSLALERGRAEDAHRLSLRLQDAALDDRRQLIATLTTLSALRLGWGPALTASARARPAPCAQMFAPAPGHLGDNVVALAGVNSAPDPDLRRLLERLRPG